MDRFPEDVQSLATGYRAVQPLAVVEEEHLEILPSTLADGDYGWRDAEWIVQWYYRRFLGAYPDADRRAAEAVFGENDYEAVHAAITRAIEAEDDRSKLDLLTELSGVDVPLASAFLTFIQPSAYIVMSAMEWRVLHQSGELDDSYPDHPSAAAYRSYLDVCREIADRRDCDLWTVYTAMWRCWYEESRGGPTGRRVG